MRKVKPEEKNHTAEHARRSSCGDEDQRSNATAHVSPLKVGVGLIVLACLAGAYWALSHFGYLGILSSEERLRGAVEGLGWRGIIAVIFLIAVAIIMSPIPSGPIAVVAGAVYGPLWGGIYTIIGSVMGAALAFGLARFLGYDVVCRWLKDSFNYLTQKRSQNRLMGIVFLTRLVPFISFDAISYAAGLTPLSFWRFVIATLAGVIPISFLLTFFGGHLIKMEPGWSWAFTILVGTITVLPIAIKWIKRRKNQRK